MIEPQINAPITAAHAAVAPSTASRSRSPPGVLRRHQQELIGLVHRINALADDVYVRMDRFTAIWHENLLLQEWLPAVPAVQDKLERGVRVADVGCGLGRALIKLMERFPHSTFVGYDVFAPNVKRGQTGCHRPRAHRDRRRSRGTAGAIHVTPGMSCTTLSTRSGCSVRSTTRWSPRCLPVPRHQVLGPHRGEHRELGRHALRAQHPVCMSSSPAHGGAGLATLELHEAKLRELCSHAGFGTVRQVPTDNPVNSPVEVRP